MNYQVTVYRTPNYRFPFEDWIENLDIHTRQRIRMKLGRLELGNFGNCRSIGGGIHELKIDYGPGYRIYYSSIDLLEILILFAGTKRTQQRDIEKARKFLKEFKTR